MCFCTNIRIFLRLKLNRYANNFHPLEVAGRGSETQLQVGENLNGITWRVNGWETSWTQRVGTYPRFKPIYTRELVWVKNNSELIKYVFKLVEMLSITLDVRLWRLKSIPSLEDVTIITAADPWCIAFQMNIYDELKLNQTPSVSIMVYTNIFQRCKS